MATSPRAPVESTPINLRERIAALEQRTATPAPDGSSQAKPSGIPQLTNNVHLRDKIAKFERKGGIPVPRGRFGMGAPPTDSGKPRKQGELYGNRIPRIVSAGGVGPPRPGFGGAVGQPNRRSMSMSGPGLESLVDCDASSTGSPCLSDFDTNSEGPLSPDAEKTFFAAARMSMGSPDTPDSESKDEQEGNREGQETSIPIEQKQDTPLLDITHVTHDVEKPETDGVPGAVEMEQESSSMPADDAPNADVVDTLDGPAPQQQENFEKVSKLEEEIEELPTASSDQGSTSSASNKEEETEVEHQLLDDALTPPEPDVKHDKEVLVHAKVDYDTAPEEEAKNAFEHDEPAESAEEPSSSSSTTSSSSLSRSSSLRTLTPMPRAAASTSGVEEEQQTAGISDAVPVISLSPPPSAEDVAASLTLPTPSSNLVSPLDGENENHAPSSPVPSSPVAATSSVAARSPTEDSTPSSRSEFMTRIPSPVLSPGRSSPVRTRKTESEIVPAATKSVRSARRDSLSLLNASIPLSPTDKDEKANSLGSSPTITVTSPPTPSTKIPVAVNSRFGGHDSSDKRASMPPPSSYTLPLPSFLDLLSPTSDTSSVTTSLQSPVFSSPTETVALGSPLSPSTSDASEGSGNQKDRGSVPSALSPTSPSSRFRDPPARTATKGRPNTFHAAVRSKVKEQAQVTAPALPSSQFLAAPETPQVRKVKQSGKVDIPPSPGTGELVSLLHEAALLEHALTQGELDLSLNLGAGKSSSTTTAGTTEESNRESEETQTDKEEGRRVQRSNTEESAPVSLRSRLAFRLPLKKKTKHWKASSTNAIMQEDIRVRRSLDMERNAGLSVPDPAFLKTDPVTKMERVDEAQPTTPTTSGLRKNSLNTPPKSPRLLAGFKKLASSGSVKSFQMSGAHPRHSASTSSELSSEDSMAVVTPPDASVYSSKDGMSSTQSYDLIGSHGPGVPWPSVSPKRSLARAASFAEKLFGRSRTKSNGSTLSTASAQEPRGGGRLEASASNIKAASSSNLATAVYPKEELSRGSFKLDLPVLTPTESLFDSPTLEGASPTFSLPNPYSPSPSAQVSPAKGAPLAKFRPRTPGEESWVSEASQLDPELFDAFPSVPQQPLTGIPSLRGLRKKPEHGYQQQHRSPTLPSISVGSSLSTIDPFVTNIPQPRSATLPRRNATLPLNASSPPHTAGAQAPVDSLFLGRASTMPKQRPSAEYRPTRS